MQHNYHPLLQSQLGVFIECMQYPDCTQYNLPIFTPLGREEDMDRMERAFHVIYDSRVAWRLRFGIDEEGTPYQYEDDGKEFRVVRREMNDAELQVYAHNAFIRPFDLMGDEPLVRVELVSTEVQDYLLMDVHHLIMDGMSYTPIWTHQEFKEAYQHGVLPVETYTLLNAADDEQESLHGAAYEKAKAYYVEKYSDVDFATLSLRPANPLGQMLRVHELVDKAAIDEWCKEHGVAVNLLFQTAFSYVLSVLLREDRIAYTTVSHGRFDRRWRNIFGMFSREMPVMSEVKDGQTVLNYIRSFRTELMSTIRNAAYPISHLCRDLKKMPGVCFNFQGMEGAEETLETGTGSYQGYEQVRNIVTKDMTVLIFPMQDEYDIRVESSEAYNSRETMQMVARAIGVTLRKMMQQPDAAVKSLSIVSEEEELHLIELGTGERLVYDDSKTFIDLFRYQAKKTPAALAVVDYCSQLTYRELDEASDEYAKTVTHGTFVCVEMPRVKEFVVAVLGIWKAGSAYVPIDMEYPEERKHFMREECDGEPLPSPGIAYMIYTSGSTGKPKGVMNTHTGLLNFILWNNNTFVQHSGTRHIVHSSFSFDATLFDIFCPLSVGATVHIIKESLRYDLNGLASYIRENKITGMLMTPQAGAELLQGDLPLDYIILGGDKMPKVQTKGIHVYNAYGPTEFTSCSSIYRLQGKERESVPIGMPVPNTLSLICDKGCNILPRGVVGELCLAGPQIALGYWNNPELTAERIVEKMLNGKKERIYKTGDLCRWNSDGQLEYIGRIDNQIKLRGFRIELGEIESAVMQIEGIKQAVATVKNEQIVLYYVCDEMFRNKSLLSISLSEVLPEYMVPSMYMQLVAMPLTPNGKIDKKSLPEPEYVQEECVFPCNAVEQAIAEEFQHVLGLSTSVSTTIGFAALGGDSIKAMRLSSRLHQRGYSISVNQILALKTVRALAGDVVNRNVPDYEPGLTFERKDYYPLSSTSRSMLLSDLGTQYQVGSHPHSYMKFDGTNVQSLIAAINRVVEANPFLKARIEMCPSTDSGQVLEPMWHRDDDREFKIAVEYVETIEDVKDEFTPYNLIGDDLSRFTIYESKSEMLLYADFSHLIMDGISLGLFERALHSAYYSPDTAVIPSKATGYDLSAIEQHWLESGDNRQKAELHFESIMRDAVSMPYPYSRTLDEGQQSYSLNRHVENSVEITDFCKQEDITVNTYLQTALLCALMRILRQDKLVIFCVSSGRNMVTQNVIGNMAKSLPFVGNMQWLNLEGKTLLKEAASQYFHSLQYEMYPTRELTSKYNTKLCLLYSSEIMSDEGLFDEYSHTDLTKKIAYCGEVITFFIYKSVQGNYALSLNYDGSLYSCRDMQALLDAWYMMSREICRQNCAVKLLSIVTGEEQKRILDLGDGDVRDPYKPDGCVLFDEGTTIVDKFLRVAHETPQKEIVIDYCGSFTLEQLNLYSNKVAHWILAQGIPHGSAIGVLTPRCKEYMALAFGVLKANCAIVTLELDYPEHRRKQIVEEADIRLVLTLDTLKHIIDSDITDKDICLCTVESTFQIFFTSGTTGRPKGVVRTLAEITNNLNNTIRFGYPQEDAPRIVFVRFSFVACLGSLWLSIACGNTSHILKQETVANPSALSEYIRSNNITISLMPANYGVMLINNYDLPSLKDIILSAEKLPPVRTRKVRVTNLYACTEVLWITSKVVTPDDTRITAGTPTAGCQLYILDEYQNLLPQGIVGEICISSNTMAKEYLNDPELNGKKFIANPFCPGKRMLRTGDLGYLDENGELNVVGRMDNMVKLHGFRIELDEITHTAMQCPGIDMCACIKYEANGDEFLCCYYTSVLRVKKEVLKSYLAKHLPSYMVPEIYMLLDKMPLNANGKIDRDKLPEPETQSETLVTPATKDEQDVLDVVEDVLSVSPISVTANLISLGLSSIAGMRLSMLISQTSGKNISISQLMSAPTIRDIAAKLKNRIDDNLGRVRDRQEDYPLTDNQLGVYLDWEQHRDNLQYNVPVAIKLKGYDAIRLQAAIGAVVSAHPYLFAQFNIVDGEVRIRRVDNEQLTVDVVQLETEPTAEFFQSRVRPFNLLEDRLFRFEIYTYGEATYLFEDIHHIITDGVSDAQLISEIYAAYNGETIEAETYTAYDRALEEQEIKASPKYTEAEAYYKNLLSGVESTVYYPHSAEDLGTGMAKYVRNSLTKRIVESHCAKLGVTPSNYLLTVFMEVLKRITREDKILVTTVNSGREHAAMQKIQGFFVKTLPVLSENTVVGVQHQLIESISHECYSLTEMVQTFGVHPEIMYVYEGGLINDERIRGIKDFAIIPLSLDTVKVPLSLIVNPGSEDYKLIVEYNDALYNEHDMQTLLHCVIALAENYAKETAASLQDCSMLTDEEEQCLVELGTSERLEYDKTKTFIDLFNEQVVRTPNTVAVVDHCSQLTYKELDIASDEYAKTVDHGTFVCLEMPRVKEFVVAVLGIWKAGSAYVPIDMEYPEERKLFMREECDGMPLPSPDVAYMIYTSGSTGKPKGVMVQHSAISAFVAWRTRMLNLNITSRIAHYSNFAFDASLDDIVCPLVAGAEIFILHEKVRSDLKALYEYLTDNRITGLTLPTQLGEMLINDYPGINFTYLMMGGEKLKKCADTEIRLINGYGPTEFTVCSSYYEVKGNETGDYPIGRPVPNSHSYICDNNGLLLPHGTIGELCLVGPQMALGYWNNLKQTAERFVEITLNGKKERLYKTGDLCRWNSNGLLEYIGRIDNQVKLRGYRIELGEIESAAMQTEGIKQAVAVVKNNQIVLYYTGESKSSIMGDIEGLLPKYMVPEVYMLLDKMPLNANGKIDRRALPEPVVATEVYEAPANPLEQQLHDIICEVLGVENISVLTDIHKIGMTSLKSMTVAMHVANQTGIRLSASDVMDCDSVRDIAVRVEEKQADFYEMILAEKHPVSEAYKANQLHSLFLNSHYAEGFVTLSLFSFAGIDSDVLASCMEGLVEAHPVMKSTLENRSGEWWFIPHLTSEFKVDVQELDFEPDNAYFEKLPLTFDVNAGGPLCRISIYKAPERVYLLMACHHTLTDSVSMMLLARDAVTLMSGGEIEAVEHDYLDYLVNTDNIHNSQYSQQQLEVLDKELDGCVPVTFPASSCPDSQSDKAGYAELSLEGIDIDGYCQDNGSTPMSLFLMAAGRVFRERMMSQGKNVGKLLLPVVNHGRSSASTFNGVGCYLTLSLVKYNGTESSAEVAQQVRDSDRFIHQSVDWMTRKGYSLEDSVYFNDHTAFQAATGVQDDGSEDSAPFAFHDIDYPKAFSPLQLALSGSPEQGYSITADYDAGLYAKADILGLLKSIAEIIKSYL